MQVLDPVISTMNQATNILSRAEEDMFVLKDAIRQVLVDEVIVFKTNFSLSGPRLVSLGIYAPFQSIIDLLHAYNKVCKRVSFVDGTVRTVLAGETIQEGIKYKEYESIAASFLQGKHGVLQGVLVPLKMQVITCIVCVYFRRCEAPEHIDTFWSDYHTEFISQDNVLLSWTLGNKNFPYKKLGAMTCID